MRGINENFIPTVFSKKPERKRSLTRPKAEG
jgi:hypothetical protein